MGAAEGGKFLDGLAQMFFGVVVVVDLVIEIAEEKGEGRVAVGFELGQDDLDGLLRLGAEEGKRFFVKRAVLGGEFGFDGFVDAVGSEEAVAEFRAVGVRVG